MPLSLEGRIRVAQLHALRNQYRPPALLVECAEGDPVIVAHEGVYLSGVIEEPRWWNPAKRRRVRLDDGTPLHVPARDVVKREA